MPYRLATRKYFYRLEAHLPELFRQTVLSGFKRVYLMVYAAYLALYIIHIYNQLRALQIAVAEYSLELWSVADIQPRIAAAAAYVYVIVAEVIYAVLRLLEHFDYL